MGRAVRAISWHQQANEEDPMHSLVKDLMTTQVVTVGPATPFKDLVARLAKHRVSAVPVVDDARRVLGVVSEADLLLKEEFPDPDQDLPLLWTKRRRLEREKAAGATARDLMTVALVSISPDATVAEAARRMHRANIKRLPVIGERGRLVGIVSRSDLLKVFKRPDHAIRREIIDDVIGGECRMGPSRFFIHVDDGVVVLQGQVERRSVIPDLVRAVHGVEGVVRVESRLAMTSTMSSLSCRRWPTPRSVLNPGGKRRRGPMQLGAPAACSTGPMAGQVERFWRGGSRKTDSTSSMTRVARSANRAGRNGASRPSAAWVATSSATSRPSTGARVTPLWLTATYSPSSQGSGPTIGRRSAGMARQASHHRSTPTPARDGKKRAAWASSARA
jgi:CBS domain-containing protein